MTDSSSKDALFEDHFVYTRDTVWKIVSRAICHYRAGRLMARTFVRSPRRPSSSSSSSSSSSFYTTRASRKVLSTLTLMTSLSKVIHRRSQRNQFANRAPRYICNTHSSIDESSKRTIMARDYKPLAIVRVFRN